MIKDLFVPYFVVYRYKDNPNDSSLYINQFLTLSQLYAFIGGNVECWSMYRVGRCLEFFEI